MQVTINGTEITFNLDTGKVGNMGDWTQAREFKARGIFSSKFYPLLMGPPDVETGCTCHLDYFFNPALRAGPTGTLEKITGCIRAHVAGTRPAGCTCPDAATCPGS